MGGQDGVARLAGHARFSTYLQHARDAGRAEELYIWAQDLAGALHSNIAYVEVAVRNALSPQLADWNERRQGPKGHNWALDPNTDPDLYGVLVPKLVNQARSRARSEAKNRAESSPRYCQGVNNDDVVAQFMFGTWVNLISPLSGSDAQQKVLWVEALHLAFPSVSADEPGRVRLGKQLHRIRQLRNRVAHHDNLLDVNIQHRLNDMLAVLSAIDPDFPALAMARSRTRQVAKGDPRLQ